MQIDRTQLGHERGQIVHRQFVELDAIDARFRETARLIGPRLHEQLLLHAAATEGGKRLQERLEAAHEGDVMVEHEHGLGRAQAVREGAAAGDRLREQVFHPRHALARGEHLACGVSAVRRVHDRARLGRHARQVVAQVERHLPRHMQRRRRALRAKERLPRDEALPRATRPHDVRARLPKHAGGLFHAGEHAVFAREVLDFPQFLADAKDFGRKIDIGHVFENELIDAAIGNKHVHEDPFHLPLRRVCRNPLIRLSR